MITALFFESEVQILSIHCLRLELLLHLFLSKDYLLLRLLLVDCRSSLADYQVTSDTKGNVFHKFNKHCERKYGYKCFFFVSLINV